MTDVWQGATRGDDNVAVCALYQLQGDRCKLNVMKEIQVQSGYRKRWWWCRVHSLPSWKRFRPEMASSPFRDDRGGKHGSKRTVLLWSSQVERWYCWWSKSDLSAAYWETELSYQTEAHGKRKIQPRIILLKTTPEKQQLSYKKQHNLEKESVPMPLKKKKKKKKSTAHQQHLIHQEDLVHRSLLPSAVD